jgi:hypothetical protein
VSDPLRALGARCCARWGTDRAPALPVPLLAVLLAAACTCEPGLAPRADTAPEPPAPEPPAPEVAPPDENAATWPDDLVRDLEAASVATTVIVERARVRVDNTALVETWPASELERARRAAPAGSPEWPRVSETLEDPAADGESIPALLDALGRARDAQRAGTGAGGGGAFNLRVASDVPFATVQHVMYTAGLASFGPPRLVFASSAGDRTMPWPNGRGSGPSAQQIAQLFRAAGDPSGEVQGETPPAPPRAARLVLRAERVEAYLGPRLQAPGCAADASEGIGLTLLPDAPIDALARCLMALRGRVDDPLLTLVVEPDLPFGRVAPALVLASARFARVRVVAAPPR